MHKISITGDLETFLPKIKIPDNIKAETRKNTVFFSSAEKSELDRFKETLINPIANTIKTHYKHELIKREFRAVEPLFTESELLSAADFVKNHTYTDSFIKDKLKIFLKDSDSLSIDGFINFRLTAFRKEIQNLSADITERMLADRESKDFLRLLREFVTQREPFFDVLHIVVTSCGGYYILDEKERDITRECANSIALSFMCDEIGFDDIILYVLLSSAPQKTVIHGAQHIKCPHLAETIKEVFGTRVKFCDGCGVCSPYLK